VWLPPLFLFLLTNQTKNYEMQSTKPVVSILSSNTMRGINHYRSLLSTASSTTRTRAMSSLTCRSSSLSVVDESTTATTPLLLPNNHNNQYRGSSSGMYTATTSTSTSTTTDTKRYFGSGGGSRGARGHGWWINYRAGKGGRHLQGEYSHIDIDAMMAWNDSIFSLGSTYLYIDIQLESTTSTTTSSSSSSSPDSNNKDSGTTTQLPIHRLTIQLASAVLPKASENFIKLIQAEAGVGYKSSTLHRVEKKVGLMGGLVWKGGPDSTITTQSSKKKIAGGAIGKCHPDVRMGTSLTSMDVKEEALVVSHLPGVVTMLMPRVHEIDSRFFICSHHAPHMDGKAVAVGRCADMASLELIQLWESTLITQMGRPTNVNLRIVDCGILEMNDTVEKDNTQTTAATLSTSGVGDKNNIGTDTITGSAEEKKHVAMP
jgi:cyclophilin family peptidyl-prolyl cis-trans isomerase